MPPEIILKPGAKPFEFFDADGFRWNVQEPSDLCLLGHYRESTQASKSTKILSTKITPIFTVNVSAKTGCLSILESHLYPLGYRESRLISIAQIKRATVELFRHMKDLLLAYY
jgi:hypothetical protein